MISQNHNNKKSVDSLVRLLYSQRLMAHRRVLLLGADLELADFASKSRARHVTAVLEQNPAPPWPEDKEALDVDLQIMPFGDLRFRDGAFDIAIVPDLTALADPTVVLSEVRRVVGARGHVVVASANPACDLRLGPQLTSKPMDYYEMFDLLASMFPSVQMVGQSPFVGYAVADLSFDDPELAVSFDTSLLGGDTEEIECFLAICGERSAEIEPYSIIQIPMAAGAIGKADEKEIEAARMEMKSLSEDLAQTMEQNIELTQKAEQAKLEVGNRGVRIASLEKDLENELRQSEAARARAVQLAKELDDERRGIQKKKLEEEYSRRTSDMELQTKLRDVSVKLRQAEERARSAETGRDQLVDRMREDAAEIDRLRKRNGSLEEDLAELDRLRQKNANLEKNVAELDQLRKRNGTLEKENEKLKSSVVRKQEILEQENSKLEIGLKEKAGVVNELQAKLKERESIIRDLVVEIEGREKTCSSLLERVAELEIEKGSMARDLEQAQDRVAKLEGDLQAARWRISEIEAQSQADLERERTELRKSRQAQAEDQARIRELEDQIKRVEGQIGELAASSDKDAVLSVQLEDERRRYAELQSAFGKGEQRCTALERSSRIIEEECDRYKKRSVALEGDLRKSKERVGELENEVSAAAGRRTSLENDLAELTERLSSAEKRVSEAERRALESELRLGETEVRLKANAVELEGARERAASVLNNAKTMETEMRRQFVKEMEQANRISARAAALEEELKQARIRIEEEASRNEELSRSLEIARAELADESDRAHKAGADAARFSGNKGDLEHRISVLETELKERTSELKSNEAVIVALRAELAQHWEKVQSLRSERAADKQRMEALAANSEELEARNKKNTEQLSRELDESAKRAETAERELVGANENKEKIAAELENAKIALKIAGDEKQELLEKEKSAETSRKSVGETFSKEKLKEQEALIASLTTQLEEREQRTSRLDRQVKDLSNQIREHESDMAAWDMELKFRNSRISQLEEENVKLQETLASLSRNQ